MALTGKVKEQKNFSKYVGLFTAHVVAVNPTSEELGKLLNTTIEKEPEYTGVAQDSGAKRVTISFWLKEEKQGHLFNVRFNLEDTVNVSKTGKTQYINSIGNSSYAEDESNLPAFFTQNNRSVRKAHKGEELLYKFLSKWLSNLDYEDPSTELMLNWKKLISGKTDELRDAIKNFDSQLICALATVRTAEDGKEYQGVYSYEFLSSWAMDCFTGMNKKTYKTVDNFINKITDTEYGCKDYYELKPLIEYDPTKNVISNNNKSVIKPQETGISVSQETLTTMNEADDLPF